MERSFWMGFSVSLLCHLALLGWQGLRGAWSQPVTPAPDRILDLIYDYQLADQDLRRLQRQLQQVKEQAPVGSNSDAPLSTSQIRIPQRRAVTLTPEDLPSPSRGAVVDLTNIEEAAQGNPVLLSYFSAIREQIQRAAAQRDWLGPGSTKGLVYVSFVLSADGQIHGLNVISERSVASPILRDIAVRIVHSAGRFPPFPPSMAQSSTTVVVPLEFLSAASNRRG